MIVTSRSALSRCVGKCWHPSLPCCLSCPARRLVKASHSPVDCGTFCVNTPRVQGAQRSSHCFPRAAWLLLCNGVLAYDFYSILSEMIQNADDAGASVVKVLINHKHYGTSSLLGPRMAEWQGPGALRPTPGLLHDVHYLTWIAFILLCAAVYVYNDAEFTARDFENLSKIGQASKLDKLATTGRFGLGFNAVYHFTGTPRCVVCCAYFTC